MYLKVIPWEIWILVVQIFAVSTLGVLVLTIFKVKSNNSKILIGSIRFGFDRIYKFKPMNQHIHEWFWLIQFDFDQNK